VSSNHSPQPPIQFTSSAPLQTQSTTATSLLFLRREGGGDRAHTHHARHWRAARHWRKSAQRRGLGGEAGCSGHRTGEVPTETSLSSNEWAIPQETVVHRVTMAVLLQRGFGLERMCGRYASSEGDFPRSGEFRMRVRHRWRDLGLFGRGFEAGSVACLFKIPRTRWQAGARVAHSRFGAGSLRTGEGWD
jgi:hypothetical protein